VDSVVRPNSKIENQTFLTKESVLVIDDCRESLELQEILLGYEGYEVHTAESGNDAIELLSIIAKPSLILLDMNLGDMSGIELMNKLEETHPEIILQVPVVFLTGMNEVPESKAVGFIRKPAETDAFLADIKRFITLGQQAITPS